MQMFKKHRMFIKLVTMLIFIAFFLMILNIQNRGNKSDFSTTVETVALLVSPTADRTVIANLTQYPDIDNFLTPENIDVVQQDIFEKVVIGMNPKVYDNWAATTAARVTLTPTEFQAICYPRLDTRIQFDAGKFLTDTFVNVGQSPYVEVRTFGVTGIDTNCILPYKITGAEIDIRFYNFDMKVENVSEYIKNSLYYLNENIYLVDQFFDLPTSDRIIVKISFPNFDISTNLTKVFNLNFQLTAKEIFSEISTQ